MKKILFIFAILVIGFGAYTRLKDAGLGCPDWPTCYGHILYPQTPEDIKSADLAHPQRPFELEKAWPEMYHRHLAALLGLGIVWLAVHHIRHKKYQTSSYMMLLILAIQGILGAKTVTWLLHPHIVLAHLLGGFTLAALLFYQLISSSRLHLSRNNIAIFSLIILQIILGGWTSTNYAALICPDFPTCQGTLFPTLYLKDAFLSLLPIGLQYEFGIFSNETRVTIHMLHRYMALILSCAILFNVYIHAHIVPRWISAIPLFILCIQLLLGILNIVLLLPTSIAVLHNLTALCLLFSWIWYTQKQHQYIKT
jgi:cytochrome c oxidase assembly protein subunit 15